MKELPGGAGGHEAERLSVKVVPDTGGFRQELEKFLKEEEAKSKVTVEVNADTAKAKAELDKLAKDLTVKLQVDLNAADVRAQLARLSKDLQVHLAAEVDDKLALAKLNRLTKDRTAKINADLDSAGVTKRLQALARNLSVKLNVSIDEKGVRQRLARLAKDLRVNVAVEVDAVLARQKLAALTKDRTMKLRVNLDATLAKAELLVMARDRHTTIHVNTDHNAIDQLSGALGGLSNLLGDLGQSASSAFNTVSRSAVNMGSSVGSSASSAGGQLMSLSSVAMPAMVVAVTILVGAIAGLVIAVGALVGALALVVLPVALVAAGVMFATLGQKGYGTAKKLSAAYSDVAKTIKSVMNSAVKPMADEISRQIPKLNAWIMTLKGPLKSAFDSASKFIPGLGRAFGKFTTELLTGMTVALKSPGMKAAMNGFNDLIGKIGQALGAFFIQLSNNGPAFGKTLTALGDALVLLAPDLALMLGAFASVSPEVIASCAKNLQILFALFSNPQILSALSQFANFSFEAITVAIMGVVISIMYLVSQWQVLVAGAQWTANLLKTTWNALLAFLGAAWNALWGAAVSAFNGIKSAVVSAANATVNGAINAWNRFTGWISGIWNTLTGISSSGSGRVKMVSLGGFQGIADGARSIIGGIVGVFQGVWNTIAGIVSNIIGAVGRAKSAVGSVGGLLSKINPFSMVGPTLPPPPDGGVYTASVSPMGGLIADLGRMATDTSKLGNLGANPGTGSFGSSASGQVLSKIYNITLNAAPDVPTEKTLIKALGYADGLYAT